MKTSDQHLHATLTQLEQHTTLANVTFTFPRSHNKQLLVPEKEIHGYSPKLWLSANILPARPYHPLKSSRTSPPCPIPLSKLLSESSELRRDPSHSILAQIPARFSPCLRLSPPRVPARLSSLPLRRKYRIKSNVPFLDDHCGRIIWIRPFPHSNHPALRFPLLSGAVNRRFDLIKWRFFERGIDGKISLMIDGFLKSGLDAVQEVCKIDETFVRRMWWRWWQR
ncbi:hypothetical protein BJ508DRAFT_156054 [Ascobolus immersus RN42]|uniref:Uncharacterized protein n=1 Tax=Ascobolus immersus RN42 TaxID=1160509 RepID=A0A3N4I2M2_ASCIM|nr:hypothetical protein BJ508DRAFT_156054 [Ascobolus immersus RN42]